MSQTLTKNEANRLIRVTQDRHDMIGHLAIDHRVSMIQLADEALDIGLRQIQSRRKKAKPSPSHATAM